MDQTETQEELALQCITIHEMEQATMTLKRYYLEGDLYILYIYNGKIYEDHEKDETPGSYWGIIEAESPVEAEKCFKKYLSRVMAGKDTGEAEQNRQVAAQRIAKRKFRVVEVKD